MSDFIGIGGSGRQSAAKLATFMADYTLFQIEITRNYTVNEWREDIKKVSEHVALLRVANCLCMRINYLNISPK